MSQAEPDPGRGPIDRELQSLIDEEARREGVARRRRQYWLLRQARESATWIGILAELAGGGVTVLVRLGNGVVHECRVTEVGVDFVALETGSQQRLVALHAVAAVLAPRGDPVATGAPNRQEGRLLADVLRAEAPLRPAVAVRSIDDRMVEGTLQSVGQDVAVVITAEGTAYLPISAMADVLVR